MNFIIGIITGIAIMAALIEWRTCFYPDILKYGIFETINNKLNAKKKSGDD